MGLRPTHLGYAYQDLLTALRLVDLAVGRARSVTVDTKMFAGDRFDDITCEWATGSRERLQIKHTDHDRALSAESFIKDSRSLRLDLLFSSIDRDLISQPATSHRLVVRDAEPDEPDLMRVLQPVSSGIDPGPALHGLGSKRFRFDAAALRAHDPWQSVLADVSDEVLRRACACLIVDTGVAACSLNIREPGSAEAALLHRVTEELGAGRPPNRTRTAEDVALALIETAKAARSRTGTVTLEDLLPRLGLETDFGAVREGHPVDRATEVTRPAVLAEVVAAVEDTAQQGGVVVVTGAPGIGKSWLCEQLGDALHDTWLAVRHHCWLGAADADRGERVLTEVVIGSLLRQLESAAPQAVAQVRPRYAATKETLVAAVTAVRGLLPDRPVALVVDGIDHVSRVLGHSSGGAFGEPVDPAACLVEELTSLSLPPGVVLVLASQPGPHLEAVDAQAARLTVPPLDRAELGALAERLGVLSALAPSAAGLGAATDAEAAVTLIEERSRGNALYATYLCRQALGPAPGLGTPLAPGAVGDPLERLRAIPSSAHDLDDYYAYLLRALTVEQRYAVSTLAVCDFAVSADELGEIFPMPAMMIGAALSRVAPIIAQQPGIGGLKIHHESFSRFVRRAEGDSRWVDEVRAKAAQWLSKRGFFTDARAFRHLPELLSALGRDEDLALLIGPDFLSRAIAGLQPPQALVHTLAVVARRAAARCDWPTLVRCIELSRARSTFEDEGLPGSLVPYADVLVALSGADHVAAGLLYEGVPTLSARWGLQLCAAIDRAGFAAPWEAYLTAWDNERGGTSGHDGSADEEAVFLAELRGRIRLPGHGPGKEESPEGHPLTLAQRVARFLDQEALGSPGPALGVLLDCLGAEPLWESAALIERPERRAALLLHLADARASASSMLPSARTLATAAWASAPCDPRRLLDHGVPAEDLSEEVFGGDVTTVLQEATRAVLTGRRGDLSGPVSRWLELLSVAQAADPQAPARLLPLLDGEGFFRAWLRFAATTLGLGRDVDAGRIPADRASAAARVALEELSRHAAAFTGRPNASELMDIHHLVRQVLHEAVALLHGNDVALGITSLQTVSQRTTTSLMGMAGSGPLITTELLSLLAHSVGQAGAAVIDELMRTLRTAQAGSRSMYAEDADFELEMARVSLACGDPDEAQHCWERAARYMGAYGGHKDITIEELLEPLPQLLQADPVQARLRLARTQPLVYLVAECTDGRGTAGTPQEWWRLLAHLDPRAAAQLAARVLLTEPGLPDARVDAAHQQLLAMQANSADPVVLAVLRIAAGSRGRSLDADIALLGRLADLPGDDAAHALRLMPVLANAITSTYDDQTLIHASHLAGDTPSPALRAAAQRLGGEGGPPWTPRPVPSTSSREWSGRQGRYPTGAFVHAQQRPVLPEGAAGVLAAVRDCASKAYDDPPGPRWSADALANAVGWRLVEITERQGPEVAGQLLHRIAQEMNTSGPVDVLADVAAGLYLRQDITPDVFGPLAATAGMLAYTTIRGGGGWRSFAGNDRLELWQQAHTADAAIAAQDLANQVANAVANPSYGRTVGVSQALVSAFAVQPPDASRPPAADALACWDAAYDVIAHRLPGDARLGDGVYHPVPEPATQHDIGTALCRLALSTVALPERGDKRRALLAATVLLAARPRQAQAALAHVLSFGLGAGPLTWLLTVLHSRLPDGPLDAALHEQLVALCTSDMLSVRVEASAVLTSAGHQPPSPPATTAHPALAHAIAAQLRSQEGA